MPSNKKSRKKQKGKGKLKKEARKEALAAEKAKRALVNAARVDASGSPHNVLAQFAPFAKYDRNELDLVIEFAAPSAISTEDMDWMLALTRANMEEMYVDGGWGWNDTEKRRELMDDEARHLLVRRRAPTAATGDESKDGAKAEAGAGAGAGAGATSGELVAFAHFRFLLEDEYPVLYVQEIQLTEPVQRKGLGKHMMQVRRCVPAACVGTVRAGVHTSSPRVIDVVRFLRRLTATLAVALTRAWADPGADSA